MFWNSDDYVVDSIVAALGILLLGDDVYCFIGWSSK